VAIRGPKWMPNRKYGQKYILEIKKERKKELLTNRNSLVDCTDY